MTFHIFLSRCTRFPPFYRALWSRGGVILTTTSRAMLATVRPSCFELFYMFSRTLFAGDRCAELDDCASEPCQNDGECSSLSGAGYTCRCQDGFNGPSCERDINAVSYTHLTLPTILRV